MVPVLVLLTFAALVALDRFVLSKGYLEEKSGWPATLETLPAEAASALVPDEVRLQPTYTWSRAGERGGDALYVGVHPLLLDLVGLPCELDLRAPGERVAAGDSLVRIGCGSRRLTVHSPVAGRVERVNPRAAGATRWRVVPGEGAPWLYRIRGERTTGAAPAAWLKGDAALEWTRRQYRRLSDFLQAAAPAAHLGPVVADGGRLRAGLLREMDAGVWAGLDSWFLAPSGPAATRPGDRAVHGEETGA